MRARPRYAQVLTSLPMYVGLAVFILSLLAVLGLKRLEGTERQFT
jgi:hypothetical protein